MEKIIFRNLLREIDLELHENKSKINEALNKEMSKGNFINIQKVSNVIKNYLEMDDMENENKKIAVAYTGHPVITISYILDSILYNNQITLCVNENKIINDALITLVVSCMRKLNIKNMWINYNSTHNEIYLKDNEDDFDEIVYIGDFYEYEMFKSIFTKEVKYNNFGYMKLLINKNTNAEEFKRIMNYTNKENIYLEVYSEIDEFINESKEQDYAVAFINDFKDINKLQKGMRAGDLVINAFPYDTYGFKIR